MKKNNSIKKPVLSTKNNSQTDELALDLFSKYAGLSNDIIIMNSSKKLLFLNDYQYTLDVLKANNSSYERMLRICDDDLINSL